MRNVLHGQQERVAIFNITYMAERRNDAHPGNLNNIAQKGSSAQDCVHWCLPGMPDIWNRFLMVHLERKLGSSPPGPGIPRKLPPTEDL